MMKYKRDLMKALTIIVPLVLAKILSLFSDDLFFYAFASIYFVFLIYGFYNKIKYRSGQLDYILFSTLNDDYKKITYMVFGFGILIGGGIYGFNRGYVNIELGVVFLLGFLILLNGLYDLPNGLLRVKGEEIEISGLEVKINKQELMAIEVFGDRIGLTKVNGEKLVARNFNIDKNQALLIENYILSKTNNQLIVRNKLSHISHLNTQI